MAAGELRVERDGTFEQLDRPVAVLTVGGGESPLAEIELPLGERVVHLGVGRAALAHPGLPVG